MLSLIFLFAVTLSVIMLASLREIRQQNSEMLERYVELYSLDLQPEPDGVPELKPADHDIPDTAPKKGDPPPDLARVSGFQLFTQSRFQRMAQRFL